VEPGPFAQGVVGMRRQLCPDLPRMTVATLASILILVSGQAWVQLVAVALGGVAL